MMARGKMKNNQQGRETNIIYGFSRKPVSKSARALTRLPVTLAGGEHNVSVSAEAGRGELESEAVGRARRERHLFVVLERR
jgi:hypothetical protein